MWRMFRDARILGILGLVVLAGVIALLNATAYSPAATVVRYLSALERGDDAELRATFAGSVANVSSLRSPRLAEHRPSDPVVTSVSIDGTSAKVTARVTLDGQRVVETFVLRDERGWSPISQWRFDVLPVATVSIGSVPAAPVSINGATAVPANPTWVPVVAEITAGTAWFDAQPTTVVATTAGGVVRAEVAFTPTAAVTKVVNDTVRDYVVSCAEQITLVPAKCPFAGFTAMRIAKGPVWEIVEYPAVAVDAGEGRWTFTGDGKVRLVVTLVDFATERKEKYSQLMDFTVSGSIVDLVSGAPRIVVNNTVER